MEGDLIGWRRELKLIRGERNGMIKIDIDLDQIQKFIQDAVGSAMERQFYKNNFNLPPLLTRTQLQEVLEIGSTKTAELLNRQDFPVIREFGHPRIPTQLLFIWINEHTDWVRDNAKNPSLLKVI